MEENEYRSTYNEVNQIRCAFEKAILSRRCSCSQSHKFCLAEREGVSCQSALKQERCQTFLKAAREKALFVFKLTQFDGVLPHAKEIRVQIGSLSGLAESMDLNISDEIEDIDTLLKDGELHFGNLTEIPYDILIRAINRMQARKRRPRRK